MGAILETNALNNKEIDNVKVKNFNFFTKKNI
jgi:hypothetical protein